jgi:catechol 2,3-dioxygenase-like lactoylglutathione lyase family enzyme
MSGPITGLDHVQVAAPAGCESEARRFYGALLGLDEITKPPLLASRGGVWFRVGAQELHVGVADAFVAADKAHPALHAGSLRELERLAARLEADGVDVGWAEADEIPGTRRFFVHDPWGNRVELLCRSVDF